ncbi:MAG: hypothetical protein LC624_11155 [Halobacteriales archaeon]|nr:hypothetical protein [Halobacteriales archaeon]
MMRAGLLVLLVTTMSFGAGAAQPHGPLAQLEAQLAPLGDWSGLGSTALARSASVHLLPGQAVEARLDGAGVLTVRALPGFPIPGQNQDATGCLELPAASAQWEPSPPPLDQDLCVDQFHDGGVSAAYLACAGALPTFGCAHVGYDAVLDDYFGLLCGYPEGVGAFGIRDPADGYDVQCSSFGPGLGTLQSWHVTLSQNTVGLTYGELDP